MRIVPGKSLTGTLVEWDEKRGFGFLEAGEAKVFLHRHEFTALHKRLELGDAIQFSIGLDARGRVCAKNAAHVNDGGKLTASAVLFLAILLAAPVFALTRLGIKLSWIGGVGSAMGCITYVTYAVDKRRAKQNRWRISEATLHLLDLLGGWPGAFIAQRRLRHKVSKMSYQIVFWFIVLAYQFAAVDSLLDWKLTRMAMDSIEHRQNSVR
jgi:uncharacterized membrane protein YsdA (DUF1294 family)/cold shock CspA family protein